MNECTVNKVSSSDISVEKLLEAIKQFSETLYEITNIFLGNPYDLIEIDMSKIPSNCFFISNKYINKGEMLKIEDGELKRNLYEFIGEHPDRVFRGKK
jgi:hypothetical protein